MNVLIVGSGITGSLISRYLSRHGTHVKNGLSVTIFDKARGPGGRFCTHRRGGLLEDVAELGAQYVTKSPETADEELYEELLRSNQFVRLPSSSIRGIHEKAVDMEHYEAPGGLASVAENLVSEDARVSFSRHVSEILQDDGMYRVRYRDYHDDPNDDARLSEPFDKVVLTPPGPQVVDLLRSSSLEVPDVLKDVKYSSRFAVALYPEDPSSMLRPSWSCAYTKGDRLVFARFHRRSIVLHASVPFTLSHYEENRDEIVRILSSDFKEYMGWSELPRISHAKCHRWRYSQTSGVSTSAAHDVGALEVQPGLFIAGDGLLGSNFDKCSKSARDAAQMILASSQSSSSSSSPSTTSYRSSSL